MKRQYGAPTAEKIRFCYRDQIMASGGGGATCTVIWLGDNSSACQNGGWINDHY